MCVILYVPGPFVACEPGGGSFRPVPCPVSLGKRGASGISISGFWGTGRGPSCESLACSEPSTASVNAGAPMSEGCLRLSWPSKEQKMSKAIGQYGCQSIKDVLDGRSIS